MRRGFRLSAFVVALCVPLCQYARGERVEPPLELLYAPSTTLVAGALVDIDPKGRLVFARGEVLAGNRRTVPDQIDVRVPPATPATVQIGQHYVFAYSNQRADPRKPTRVVMDPKGAVMIGTIGLDPALFRDTASVRALLKAGRSEHGRESRRFFDLLTQALAGDDATLQYLAAGQIALDPEIGERLREDASARAGVEKAVRDAKTSPRARSTLLVAADGRPADFGAWSLDASRDIVTSTPLGGYHDASSDPTDLVLTALELLDKHQAPLASDVVRRWIKSANPALAERACLLLRRTAPAEERAGIRDALADPALAPATRKFLVEHVRRLDRIEERSKARKEGSGHS